jgi:hypothetical protein
MARLSVAQVPCSAVLPTVHGCHYAFQKFPFFCVTLYMGVLVDCMCKGANACISYQSFFIYQLMHKIIALKRKLKFTLKQLRHVSV